MYEVLLLGPSQHQLKNGSKLEFFKKVFTRFQASERVVKRGQVSNFYEFISGRSP